MTTSRYPQSIRNYQEQRSRNQLRLQLLQSIGAEGGTLFCGGRCRKINNLRKRGRIYFATFCTLYAPFFRALQSTAESGRESLTCAPLLRLRASSLSALMVNSRPADYTEAQEVVLAHRIEPAADRQTAALGSISPAATTHHPVEARSWPSRISRW